MHTNQNANQMLLYIKNNQLFFNKSDTPSEEDCIFDYIHEDWLKQFAPGYYVGTECSMCEFDEDEMTYRIRLIFGDTLAWSDTIVEFTVDADDLSILDYRMISHEIDRYSDEFEEVTKRTVFDWEADCVKTSEASFKDSCAKRNGPKWEAERLAKEAAAAAKKTKRTRKAKK